MHFDPGDYFLKVNKLEKFEEKPINVYYWKITINLKSKCLSVIHGEKFARNTLTAHQLILSNMISDLACAKPHSLR